MKRFLQYLSEAKKKATAAVPQEEDIGKQSFARLRREDERYAGWGKAGVVMYHHIGHEPLNTGDYDIYGTTRRRVPHIWWSRTGEDLKIYKPKTIRDTDGLIHGDPNVHTDGIDSTNPVLKGRIDHERKAISISHGYARGGLLVSRHADKHVPGIIRKLKQAYPTYGIHFFRPDGTVSSH